MSRTLVSFTGSLVLGLMVGCSSGGDPPAKVVAVEAAEADDAGTTTNINAGTSAANTTANTAEGAGNPGDIDNPVPQFITSACGSLPISDAAYSNDSSAPTRILTGQIVSGRIDPGSATNNEHFWSIALEAGYYHVVLESERADKQSANLGLRLIDLKGSSTNNDVQMLWGDQTAFRARNYAFIEVKEARVMQIRAVPNYDAEDYRLAIFHNGNAVPSPFLADCPSVKPLSVDTGEALTLPGVTGWETDRWYSVELAARADLLLNSRAAITSGEPSNIQYEMAYVDQFGQEDRFETVFTVDDYETNTAGTGALYVEEPALFWFRIQNKNQNELEFDFGLLNR